MEPKTSTTSTRSCIPTPVSATLLRSRYHEQCSTSPALCRRPSHSLTPPKPSTSLPLTAILPNPLSSAISFVCPTPRPLYKKSQRRSQSLHQLRTPRMQHKARRTRTETEGTTMRENCISVRPTSASQHSPLASCSRRAQAHLLALQDRHMGLDREGTGSHYLCALSDVWNGCIVNSIRYAAFSWHLSAHS